VWLCVGIAVGFRGGVTHADSTVATHSASAQAAIGARR
jgi:hypothetical protein